MARVKDPELDAIKVGDEVLVWGGARRKATAVIEKIGPKLVHIREHSWKLTPYWRETQTRRDGHPGGFTTLARQAQWERRDGAFQALHDYGVRVADTWTTEQLEALLGAVIEIRATSTPEIEGSV